MGAARKGELQNVAQDESVVAVENATGAGRFVLVCDHASNRIPAHWDRLGLDDAALASHIAWDPGALDVARRMSARLDAPLVRSTVSRLIVDCNRPVDAPDAMPEVSEATPVPGNHNLGSAERQERIALSHAPYHAAIEALLDSRSMPTALVAIHTYTPIYKGVVRPWPVGIIFNKDRRLSDPLIEHLRQCGLNTGVNEPYSPADQVYYTLQRHGEARGLACVMVEIRNDEVLSAADCEQWSRRLCGGLKQGEAYAFGGAAARRA